MKLLLICNYKPGVGGISGQVEILCQKLREDGYTADIFSTKGSIFWRLGLFCKLRKVAKNYDVLHVHCCSGWGFLPAVIGISVGRRLRKRIVLTYHGGGAVSFFDRHPKLVKHYLTRTDVNIVLSGFLAKVFEKYHLPYIVIPNIIEFDDSVFRHRELIRPFFICTRAHEQLYNIPCILKAFQKVQAEIPEARLTLVGDGSQHEALKSMAEEMELKNVFFTGRVDNKDIYQYLDQADVFLSASTVDNMPVSVLEAMNAGLLVISSNVGGVPFVLENGQAGLLFDSGDYSALAVKMIYALNNQKFCLNIIHKAKFLMNKYCWSEIKEQLKCVYSG